MRCNLNKLSAIALSLAAFGCATPYQGGTNSLTGGFHEKPAAGKLERITFFGNGYIDAKTVEIYTLYRCAEVAKSRNKSHFFIYENLIHAAQGRPSELPTIGVVGNKPAGVAFVIYLDHPEPGAKETQKVLSELGPTIKKSQPEAKS